MFDDLVTMIIILVGFILVLASLFLPRFVKPKISRTLNSKQLVKEQEVRTLERVEEGLLELEETARQLFGRIDTRVRSLARLLEDADRKVQELKSLSLKDKDI